MYELFSPRAMAIMDSAEDEARQLHDYYLGTEHVLIALAESDADSIGILLRKNSICRQAILWELQRNHKEYRALKRGVTLPMMPSLSNAIGYARLGAGEDEAIFPVHLLQGMARIGNCNASIIARRLGRELYHLCRSL